MKRDVNGSGNFSENLSPHQDIMAIKATRAQGSTDHIKKGYLFALLITVSMGTIQFGYSIGSWNTAFNPYKNIHGWDEDTGKKNQAFS